MTFKILSKEESKEKIKKLVDQFNFDFGNYSEVSDEILNQYIIKTQEIGEGNA